MAVDAPKQDESMFNFGDVAVHRDGSRVVVTELPGDADADFDGVVVGIIDVDGMNLILRPSGTIPVGELEKEPGNRWPVEMITECVVRAEFGHGAPEDVRAGFRAIFERNSQRPGVDIPQRV